jgi:hypothetical protein|tara:strand:- start:98 stop:418 length:321 start_codon:yes stop_codon:yes gene_type:complete
MFLLRKFVLGRAIFFMNSLTKVGDTLPILDGLARVFVRRRLCRLASVSVLLGLLAVLSEDFTGTVGGFFDVAPGRFFVTSLLFISTAAAARRFADILSVDGGVFLF